MAFRSLALGLFSIAIALLSALLFTPGRGLRAELFGLAASLVVGGVAILSAAAQRHRLGSVATHSAHSG